MKRLLIILFSGILLIPVLVLCLVSKKQRIKYWYAFNDRIKTYPSLPENKIDQLFSLCVNFLLLVGKRVRMSYNEINIWIFCIIWPVLTLISIALNIVLLCI
ncbi:MAG: hypothetical protein J6S07_05540 [Bacteroidaceae bacterium]|nr:hypothetical protein [Bacteroidaceae bacterium]